MIRQDRQLSTLARKNTELARENSELRQQLDAALMTIGTITQLWNVDRVVAAQARTERYRRTRSHIISESDDQQPIIETVTDDERRQSLASGGGAA